MFPAYPVLVRPPRRSPARIGFNFPRGIYLLNREIVLRCLFLELYMDRVVEVGAELLKHSRQDGERDVELLAELLLHVPQEQVYRLVYLHHPGFLELRRRPELFSRPMRQFVRQCPRVRRPFDYWIFHYLQYSK